MKKQVLAGALAASIAAVAIAGGTLAYFTDEKVADNTFTVGGVSISLDEPKWTEPGGGRDQGVDVYPGEALPKDPTVTNTGKNPVLVRVAVDFSEAKDVTYETNYQTGALGENWYLADDGFFYYLKPLSGTADGAEAEATTALFDQIRVPYTYDNDDSGKEYNVKVTAYAVQAQGVFPSYSTVEDGIDVEEELPTVQNFFNTAFSAQA